MRTSKTFQPRQTISLGLGRITRLLAAGPYAERFPIHRSPLPFRVVHIAGTNGKGSIGSLMAGLLSRVRISTPHTLKNNDRDTNLDSKDSSSLARSPRLKIGEFVSPHLLSPADSIRINSEPLSEVEYRQRWAELLVRSNKLFQTLSVEHGAATEKIGNTDGGLTTDTLVAELQPTEFELLTTLAFEKFADDNVDVALIECGVGGRRDATNLLTKSEVAVSILGRIGLDHVKLLTGDGQLSHVNNNQSQTMGISDKTANTFSDASQAATMSDDDSLRAITWEKTGIFKSGIPVVVDGSNIEYPAAHQVILQQAAEAGVKELVWAGKHPNISTHFSEKGAVPGCKSSPSSVQQRKDDQPSKLLERLDPPSQTAQDTAFLQQWVDSHPSYQKQNLAIAMAAVDVVLSDLKAQRPRLTDKFTVLDSDSELVPATASSLLCSPVEGSCGTTTTTANYSATQCVPSLPTGRTETVNLGPFLPALFSRIDQPSPLYPSFPPVAELSLPILVDGAHNIQACTELANFVDKNIRVKASGRHTNGIVDSPPIVFIIAISHPRDPADVIRALSIRPTDHVAAVQFKQNRPGAGWVSSLDDEAIVQALYSLRSLSESAHPLSTSTAPLGEIQSFGSDLASALLWAAYKVEPRLWKQSQDNEVSDYKSGTTEKAVTTAEDVPTRRIVVAGSLYLVSDFTRLLGELKRPQ